MEPVSNLLRSWRRSAVALLGLLALCGSAHAFDCPSTQDKDGLLCYPKPRDGYTCHASLCVADCPDGYHSSGIGTCHYSSSTTYTEKPYVSRSHSGMQRCLALFYNDCRDGYHMDVCGICSYKGKWDTLRASYDRGPGSNPDVSAAFRMVGLTAQNTWGRALAGGQGLYNQAQQAFYREMNNAVAAAAKTGATNFLNKYKTPLSNISTKFAALQTDAEMVNRLRRVAVAASNGKTDPQIVDDLRYIADKVGATDLGAGWIFGVQAGISASYAVGGFETIGIAVDLKTLSTAPALAVTVNEGLSAGVSFGADFQLGIFVQQGKISSQQWSGPTLGLSVSVDMPQLPPVGISLGLSYQMANHWPVEDPSILDPNVFAKALSDYFAQGQWGVSWSDTVGVGLYPASVTVDFGTEFMFMLKP